MKASSQPKRRTTTQISWEQILANLDDGVVAVDPDGKITFFNEAAEVLTEISSAAAAAQPFEQDWRDRKSTRLNSSHSQISYAVFCLKKKKYNVHSHVDRDQPTR